MKPTINLRADGNAIIGLGHIYRMLAFAQIVQDDFECTFVIKQPEENISQLIKANRCKVEAVTSLDIDVPEVNNNLNHPLKAQDILVLDGYQFTSSFQQSVKDNTGCKLIYIDDIFNYCSTTDMIINHAGGITLNDYNVQDDTKLLLGPEYALLRKDFYRLDQKVNKRDKIEEIFINFGGADPGNYTVKIIKEIISSTTFKQVNVVIGNAYGFSSELEELIARAPYITVHKNVNAPGVKKIMQSSDAAICSASTVSYEYCSVGGLLFVISTAGNQESIFNFLVGEGLALPYAQFNTVYSSGNINELSGELIKNQRKYFDGHAGDRVQKEIKKLFLKDNLIFRKATGQDVDQYFKWANDPEVRKNSFNSSPISYETHISWFASNIYSTDASFYILTTLQNIPVASIRFSINEKVELATLNYLIDERYRGIGLSKYLLTEGTRTFFKDHATIKVVDGLVKSENVASSKAFESAGFTETIFDEPGVKYYRINKQADYLN